MEIKFSKDLFENFCDSFFFEGEYLMSTSNDIAVGFADLSDYTNPIILIKKDNGILIPIHGYDKYNRIYKEIIQPINESGVLNGILTYNLKIIGDEKYCNLNYKENND